MLKKILYTVILLSGLLLIGCKSPIALKEKSDISLLSGKWVDDYDILYTINSDKWELGSEITLHILEWNIENNYIIVKNDGSNAFNANMYSRIDYMFLNDMAPYEWGFCLTAYDKTTASDARNTLSADRGNPKSGCNGFPFSRMKRR